MSDVDAAFFKDTVSSHLDWLTAHAGAAGKEVETQRRQFEGTVKDKCEQYYLAGDVFACPCGWRATGLPGKAREHFQAAERHWAECQPGSRWTPENTRQIRRRLDHSRIAAVKVREAKAWNLYVKRRAALPARLRNITHELNPDTATKSKVGANWRLVYACKHCSSCLSTSGVFLSPCRGVPKDHRMASLDYKAEVRDVFVTGKMVDKRTTYTNVRDSPSFQNQKDVSWGYYKPRAPGIFHKARSAGRALVAP